MGSGRYWLSHLKKYGNNVKTEILGYYIDKKEKLMSYFILGLMIGSFLFVGYKYFTEDDEGCKGSCDQGRSPCDCEGKK